MDGDSDAYMSEINLDAMKRHIDRMITEGYRWTVFVNNSKISHWKYLVSFMIENCPAGDRVLLSIEECAPHSKFKNMWRQVEMFTIEMDFSNKYGDLRTVWTGTTGDKNFHDWEIYSHEIKDLLESIANIAKRIGRNDIKYIEALRNIHL